jgi:TPR repeat protein
MEFLRLSLAASLLAALSCGGGSTSVSPAPAPVDTDSPLEQACASGVVQSCLKAGDDAERSGDPEGAARLFLRACELEDASGCVFAGGALLESDDLDRARTALERACAMEDGTGCYGAGMIAAGLYGGPSDPALAATHFQAGCTAGVAAACGALAQAYGSGIGVRLDLERAALLRAQACDGGDGESCTWTGLIAWRDQQDESAARAAFEKGCGSELSDPDGCGYLGWLTWSDETNPDHNRGVALLDAACSGGSASGCNLRAVVHALVNEREDAQRLRDQACALDAEGCPALSKQFDELVARGKAAQ